MQKKRWKATSKTVPVCSCSAEDGVKMETNILKMRQRPKMLQLCAVFKMLVTNSDMGTGNLKNPPISESYKWNTN